MSMQTLTCLQIVWTFSAYTIVILGLPWLALHERFAKYPVEERLLGYFLAGNFYGINLVLVLQLLHISNRLTLLLGTMAPFVLLYGKTIRDWTVAALRHAQNRAVQLLRGERTLKTELHKLPPLFGAGTRQKLLRWLRANGLELLCLLLVVGAVFYEYGLDTIHLYGYKASDVLVHNEWINLMDENRIFQDGVYPHGFHAIIYYLEQMAGIRTYVLLRVFSWVETLYVHLALLVPLRAMCKSRYMPYLGVTAYVLLPVLNFNTYWRFTASLPQEYGMLFIVPSGFFAIRFFQEFARQLAAKDAAEEADAKQKVRFALVFFTISVSLTVTVHFYDTMVAGLFCCAIALAFFRQVFNWQYFRRIVAAGLLGIFLAFIPMAVGVLQGNALQGSFYWGMNVINGSESDDSPETIGTEILQELPPKAKKLMELLLRFQSETIQSDALQGNVEEEDASLVEEETNYGAIAAVVLMASGFLLLLAGGLSFLRERAAGRYQMLWAVGWLDLLLLLMLEAPVLDLPNLMGGNRVSEFFNYIQALVWPLLLDELLWLITFGPHRIRILNAISFGLLVLGMGLEVPLHWVRPVCYSFVFESNQAMACTANIIRENKRQDWTLFSANEERRMIEGQGYHEELITFLRELQNVKDGDVSITIPSHYVYFYIEKMSTITGASTINADVSGYRKKVLPKS